MIRSGEQAPELTSRDGRPARNCHGAPVRLADLTQAGAGVLVFLRGFT